MWAVFWFKSVFLVHYTGFRKEKQNWDIVPLTKATLPAAAAAAEAPACCAFDLRAGQNRPK